MKREIQISFHLTNPLRHIWPLTWGILQGKIDYFKLSFYVVLLKMACLHAMDVLLKI